MSERCIEIKPISQIDQLLYSYFTSPIRSGYVEIGEEKICMSREFLKIADDVENFEIRNSDVIIASHAKTGTTWTQEMVWMICNDLDFTRGKEDLCTRFPFLEFSGVSNFRAVLPPNADTSKIQWLLNSVNFTENQNNNPRFIKTHLAWSILPKQIRDEIKTPKIIYVIRDPKDACVSYYHHCKLLETYNGDLNTFCKLFLEGRLNNGPFWKNVLGFWQRRHQPNILILKYENMKHDLKTAVEQVTRFLGKHLTEEQTIKLVDHLSFENMKNNDSVNFSRMLSNVRPEGLKKGEGFMRSGQIGSHKAEMSEDMIRKFDEWTKVHVEGTEIGY